MWTTRRRILVTAAVVVVALAALVGLLWPLTDLIAASDVSQVTGAARAASLQTARAAARSQLLTLTAGVFAAAALIFTARNFALSQQTFKLTEQGQVTDRYTRAIEQLGSDKLDVRIGGIYALERIARDSIRDHPTVMEVLAAFIREHSREHWPPPEPGAQPSQHSIRPDVQAGMTVIGRRTVADGTGQINLRGANLSGADLSGADLSGANLRWANLTQVFANQANLAEAHLRGADLTKVDFSGATLNGTSFTDAKLPEAFMPGAHLHGAHFQKADLTRANLVGATLIGALCRGADFTGANLIGASLSDADLAQVNMRQANLANADFTGADLTHADLSTATMEGTIFGDTNLAEAWFPPGTEPPQGWVVDPHSGRLTRRDAQK
jgi:uncharacterized protein YjbI with pentapeptide repeats